MINVRHDIIPLLGVECKKTQNLSKVNEMNTVPNSVGINNRLATQGPALTMDMMDPPGVQRVMLSTLLRTSDVTAQHTSLHLRCFSGNWFSGSICFRLVSYKKNPR